MVILAVNLLAVNVSVPPPLLYSVKSVLYTLNIASYTRSPCFSRCEFPDTLKEAPFKLTGVAPSIPTTAGGKAVRLIICRVHRQASLR